MSVSSFKGANTTIIRLGDKSASCPMPSTRTLPPEKAPRRPQNCSESPEQLAAQGAVEVLFDFCYETEYGRKVRMRKGEKFMLLKKTNDDWYQVKRISVVSPHDPGNGQEDEEDDDDLLLDNEGRKSKRQKNKRETTSKKTKQRSSAKKNNSTGSIDVSSCDELDMTEEEESGHRNNNGRSKGDADDQQADYLTCPFYAPASYLKELVLGRGFEVDSSVVSCSSPSSTALLSGSFNSCDDSCEDVDSGNLEEDTEIDTRSNAGATSSSRESLLVDEPLTEIEATTAKTIASRHRRHQAPLQRRVVEIKLKPNSPPRDYEITVTAVKKSSSPTSISADDCDSATSVANDESNENSATEFNRSAGRMGRSLRHSDHHRRSTSPPDYVNLPVPILPTKKRNQKTPSPLTISKNVPIMPAQGHSPVRILLDHWAEYVDESGRRFYYNSVTRDSSWKPPRRRPSFMASSEDLADDAFAMSHSEENLAQFAESNESSSVGAEVSSGERPLKDISPSSSLPCRPKPQTKPRKILSTQLYSPPTLTNGWQRHLDSESREIYFVNEKTKDKWLCKLDENGRLYFFEEHGKESHWELPDLNGGASGDEATTTPAAETLPVTKSTSSSSAKNTPAHTSVKEKAKSFESSSTTTDESVGATKGTTTSSTAADTTSPSEPTAEASPSASSSLQATVTRRVTVERNSSFGRSKATGRSVPPPVLPPNSARLLSYSDRQLKTRSMAVLPTSERQAVATNGGIGAPERTSTAPTIPAALLQQASTLGLFAGGLPNSGRANIAFYQPSEPPSSLEDAKATKTGVLTRTKLIEGGRRLRKNWTNSLIALSDDYLLLFKETKPLANSANKPELIIDLAGAMVDWSPDKSSRKNVFRVSTVSGHQILFQDDCPLMCKEWFDAIRTAIIKLPSKIESKENLLIAKDALASSHSKLKRSKSQKQFRSASESSKDKAEATSFQVVDTVEPLPPERRKKITERLRQFLRRRPTLESLREKGIFKDEPVFGCVLSNLCARDKSPVPKFVRQTIQAIEHKDLKADGIYRVCGNLSQVQKIRFQVNQDNYTGLWSEEDVHVLTGLLKMFFRDMKEPLFPCSQFDGLMKAISLSERKSKSEALAKLVSDLPPPNKETLKYLLEHLLRVKEFADENRMHVQNLAIVFGPTLMWPESETNNFAYDMMLRMHQNQIIEFLLLEFSSVFK